MAADRVMSEFKFELEQAEKDEPRGAAQSQMR